jgi:hypothetical protein
MLLNVGFKARQLVAPGLVLALLGNDLIPTAGRPTFDITIVGPNRLPLPCGVSIMLRALVQSSGSRKEVRDVS